MHSLTRLTIPNHVIANFTYHAISCHMSKVIGISCVHSMDISPCRDVEVFVLIQHFIIIAISDIIAFDYFIVYCLIWFIHLFLIYTQLFLYICLYRYISLYSHVVDLTCRYIIYGCVSKLRTVKSLFPSKNPTFFGSPNFETIHALMCIYIYLCNKMLYMYYLI